LALLRQRFAHWRQGRTGRSRIPEPLWAAAVRAANTHGLNPTARALRLDYYALKKHVEAAGGASEDREAAAAFVELSGPIPADAPECIVELEDPRGAKLRVYLKGMPAPDWTALSRSFWSREA
jgi:hypothetical protein